MVATWVCSRTAPPMTTMSLTASAMAGWAQGQVNLTSRDRTAQPRVNGLPTAARAR